MEWDLFSLKCLDSVIDAVRLEGYVVDCAGAFFRLVLNPNEVDNCFLVNVEPRARELE